MHSTNNLNDGYLGCGCYKQRQVENRRANTAFPKALLKYGNIIIKDKSNKNYKVSNLVDFCKIYNLSYSQMTQVIRGKSKQHKGWTYEQ